MEKQKTIFQYSVKDINGVDISMETYKDKVLLIVNVASKCGFTPQYEGLEKLYQDHKDKGFEILGFPCNQFGSQEPGTEEEIKTFCSINYGVTFPIFSKIKVNGDNADPMYTFMKTEKPGTLGSKKIKWNFTKFLIDREGHVIKRFGSQTKPIDIEDDILELL